MAEDQNNKESRLRAGERQKEERREKMWEMRMAFIQRGHLAMSSKQYGDAAVSYEKYIRVLELVFNAQPGALSPELFKESSRTAEMSILAGALWDLVRIYDTSNKYGDRQGKYAAQLAQFAPLTPLFNEILKQALDFHKVARHPDKVKIFLAGVGKASRCFIATSAYQSPVHSDVMFLRNYRDQVLKQTFLGRKFVYFYYRHSPQVACILDRHDYLKAPTRWALKLVIKCVR